MLPDTDQSVQDFRLVIKSFISLDALYIDIGSDTDSTESKEHIITVADALYKTLIESGMFSSIDYRFSLEQLMGFYDSVGQCKASLINAYDLSALSTTLIPEEIDNRLSAAKRSLIEPGGMFMREHIQSDPLNLGSLILSKLERLNSDTEGAQMVDGRIWSSDQKHVLMIAVPKSPATDSKRGEVLISLLDDARLRALELAPTGMVHISYIGGHRATLDNAKTIKNDISKAMSAASIGIIAIIMLFFRRKFYILLIFLPMTFGVAFAAIAFAVFQPVVSAISVGCAVVLVGIVVDYGIHFLCRWDNVTKESITPKACVRTMLLPLLMGAGTTMTGLFCLLFSSLPGQRQMGVFGALGVLGSVLFVIFFLPYFVSSRRSSKLSFSLPLAQYCRHFLAWRQRHGRIFTILTVVILLTGIIGLGRLRFEGDPQKLNYLRAENLKDEEHVLKVWGDFSATSVVVRGRTLQEALQKNDQMSEQLQGLIDDEKVSFFSSISPILPSLETQFENQKNWRQFWSGEEGVKILRHFNKEALRLGFSANAFEPFYKTLQDEGDVIKLETFTESGMNRLIRTYIAEEDNGFLVMSSFFPKDQSNLEEIKSLLTSSQAGVIVTNKKNFVDHITGLVRLEFERLAVFACLAMMAFLYLFFRRVELVLSVILPVCFGCLVTLGILGLLGIAINLVSCLFVIFVFGVGIDYSIFLMNSALDVYRGRGEHVTTTLGSVVICALTTMCSFGALAFARHPALYSLGVTGLVGMTSCLLTAVLVVPMISNYLFSAGSSRGAPTLRTTSAAIWSFVYLCGAGLFYVCFVRYPSILWYYRRPMQRQHFVRKYLHHVGRGLVSFFPFPGTRGVYLNCKKENFTKTGVIVSNHLSALDIMAILALPADMVMMVKRWVWRAPLMGLLVRDAGYILVDKDGVKSVLAKGAEYLERGVSVMVFPEGSRSRDGKMGRFHNGAFELAVQTGSDIVPVLISDSQSCLAPETHWVGYSQTVVRVLPKVTAKDFDYGLGARLLCNEVKGRMNAFVHEDWRLAQNSKAFWRNIRSLYNYVGAYGESYISWKLRLDPIYRGVDALVPEKGSILDLGCGYGLMTHILARKSLQRHLTGVDFDERKIRIARWATCSNENVTFELQDLLKWEYPEADAVVLVDVLHYWSEDKQRSILSKIYNCLRPGGVLVFRDGLASCSLRHRLVNYGERFSCFFGQNRRGDGLLFGDRAFYMNAFENCGLQLARELPDLGCGSNTVMVLKKELR